MNDSIQAMEARLQEIKQREEEAQRLAKAIAEAKQIEAAKAARAQAEAEAQKKAAAELARLEAQAVGPLMAFVAQLDKIDQLRLAAGLSGSRLLSARLMEACRAEVDRLRQFSPELLGLPPRPSQAERNRREAQTAVDQAEARLAELKAIKADRDNPMRNEVKDGLLEAAQEAVKRARARLAELP